MRSQDLAVARAYYPLLGSLLPGPADEILVKFYYFLIGEASAKSRTIASTEKASTIQIQYGYGKRGSHARGFSQTLVHGNSKNEIQQKNKS